jgi:hypothetical protein
MACHIQRFPDHAHPRTELPGRAAIPFSQSVNSLLTREKNREFRRIRLLGAILKAGTRANSEACSQIPYTTEQGIFAKEQGIFTPEQGICLQKPKSSPDEVFGTHNAPCGATQPLGVGARHFRPPVPRSFNAR